MVIEMEFFNEKRTFIVYYILFGLWFYWNNTKYTILIRAYSIILTILVPFAYYCGIVSNKIFEQATISTGVAIVLSAFILVAYFIIIIESMWKNKQKELIEKFSIVDYIFSRKLNICVPYQKEKRDLLVRNVAVIIIILLLIVFFVIYLLFNQNSFMYAILHANGILRIRLMQVMFFVYLVQIRLDLINKELTAIRNAHVNDADKKCTSKDVSKISGTFEENKFTIKLRTYERILKLKLIYDNLYDAYEMINRIFGIGLLAIFVQSFCGLVSYCYWLFFIVEDTPLDYGSLFVTLNFSIQNLAPMSILAFYCSKCYKIVSNFLKVTKLLIF